MILEIIALSFVEIIGDFALKKYATNGNAYFLTIGILGYIGVVVLLIFLLKKSSVLMVNGAWDGSSALIESLAAYFLLGERFHHPLQYLGLCFIIIGIYFLKIPK